jgi:hypothetical protein
VKLESVSNSSPSLRRNFQLDALLDLPGVAGIDHLQHHAAVDLDDAAVGRATDSFMS